MPLPEPRQGEKFAFSVYPQISIEGTLGNPERVLWSSIKHLCARDVAEGVLHDMHNIRNTKLLNAAISSMKLYIQQAFEFYDAAESAKPNTAPLFYYYAFLHLAKARCEMHLPNFHRANECYRHGLTWTQSKKLLVSMNTEMVSITTRGVWHVLWEAVTGNPCPAKNPTRVKIRDLFSFCPEVSIEYGRTFGSASKLVTLDDPCIMVDNKKQEAWIRFSVFAPYLRDHRLSRRKFLELVAESHTQYRQVKSEETEVWVFESRNPIRISGTDNLFYVARDEIKRFNLFTLLDSSGDLLYAVPLQSKLSFPLTQLITLYTLLFWLGSLVRYDPHSVAMLEDSEYWVLIDGFLNQSRIWLLELFEWEFYQTQTVLMSVR